LRKLFVQYARVVLQQKTKQAPGLKVWLEKMTSHTHRHVAAVAVANKLARMAWAVLATGEAYRAPLLAAA
jgi:transposase